MATPCHTNKAKSHREGPQPGETMAGMLLVLLALATV